MRWLACGLDDGPSTLAALPVLSVPHSYLLGLQEPGRPGKRTGLPRRHLVGWVVGGKGAAWQAGARGAEETH